jgi:hypothetical protein
VGAAPASTIVELNVIWGKRGSHAFVATLNAHAVLVLIESVYTVLLLAAAILAFCIKPERLVAADLKRMLWEIRKKDGVAIAARHSAMAQTRMSSKRVTPRQAAMPRGRFVDSSFILIQTIRAMTGCFNVSKVLSPW